MITKVCGCYQVPFLKHTPIFAWRVVTWGSKEQTPSSNVIKHSTQHRTNFESWGSMYLVKESDAHFRLSVSNQGRSDSQSDFGRCFIVDMLMQQKFHSVHLIGRSWRTWNSNQITLTPYANNKIWQQKTSCTCWLFCDQCLHAGNCAHTYMMSYCNFRNMSMNILQRYCYSKFLRVWRLLLISFRGGFWAEIGQDLRVSKSNRLHIDILQFFFIYLRYTLQIPLKWWVSFLKSWASTLTDSSVTSGRFFPLIALDYRLRGTFVCCPRWNTTKKEMKTSAVWFWNNSEQSCQQSNGSQDKSRLCKPTFHSIYLRLLEWCRMIWYEIRGCPHHSDCFSRSRKYSSGQINQCFYNFQANACNITFLR